MVVVVMVVEMGLMVGQFETVNVLYSPTTDAAASFLL